MTSDETAAQLSQDQLRDVADTLKQPLSGRKVLVPFGKRAFFQAKLAPDVNDAQEELVQVKQSDGCIREMTRAEARIMLEEEYKERSKSTKQTITAAPAPEKPLTPAQANTSTTPTSSTTIVADGPLSFFDIREEIDASGNRVGGEAIDITQRLKLMEQVATDQTPVSSQTSDDDAVDLKTIDETERSLRRLDDDEYNSLAARLDHLARLEEKAEQEMAANVQSRTKLKGNTWSKGFLNSNKKSASKSSIDVSRPTDVIHNETSLNQSTRKSVAFADAGPEVKEIPRIGERSIKEEQQVLNRFKKPTGWCKGFLNSKTPRETSLNGRRVIFDEETHVQEIPSRAGVKPAPPSIKSFDEHVLSSVVSEHVVTEKQPQEPPEEEPKKLSKFAQRRLEAMQQR
jgi:hypothetical protein